MVLRNFHLVGLIVIVNLVTSKLVAASDDRNYLADLAQNSLKQHNLSCTKDSCALPSLERYLIFVSFTMPAVALKSLYLEANKHGGVLLLRGLKNGSFKETAAYIKSLEIGVQIDPIAFKKYCIDRVPTIVLAQDTKFYAISGNVSFAYAREKLLEASQ